MNYVGVAIAGLSGLFYVFVKTQVKTFPSNESIKEEIAVREELKPAVKRIIGICLAVFAGVMFGLNYAPILYVMDNYDGASQYAYDYIFSFACGSFITSVSFTLVYCIVKKNKPVIYANNFLPGFIAGFLWGIANACYLIASTSLSQSVIYPIGNYFHFIII